MRWIAVMTDKLAFLKKPYIRWRILFAVTALALVGLIVFGIVLLVGGDDEDCPVILNAAYEVNGAGGPNVQDLLTETGRTAVAAGARIAYGAGADEIDYTKVGVYTLETVFTDPNGKKTTYKTKLTVQDTVAPEGIGVDRTVKQGETLEMNAFFKDVRDNSGGDVHCYYLKAPDFEQVGTRPVIILLKDASGNEKRITAYLTVTA